MVGRATDVGVRREVDLLRYKAVAERVQVQTRQLARPRHLAKFAPLADAGRVLCSLLLGVLLLGMLLLLLLLLLRGLHVVVVEQVGLRVVWRHHPEHGNGECRSFTGRRRRRGDSETGGASGEGEGGRLRGCDERQQVRSAVVQTLRRHTIMRRREEPFICPASDLRDPPLFDEVVLAGTGRPRGGEPLPSSPPSSELPLLLLPEPLSICVWRART